MSAWICAAVSARLYTRTSSTRPWNHSGQTALPPILSAPVEPAMAPVRATVEDCVPFTNSRSAVPS